MSPDLCQLFPGANFQAIDQSLLHKAQKHLDELTKPRGSLGRLEEIAARLYAIASGLTPLKVDPCLFWVVAADHGVAVHNVSPFPQAVTRQMVDNFLGGGAGINVLAGCAGIDLRVVDAGCAGGSFPPHPLLIDRHMGDGTRDFTQEPAMDVETCVAALRAGCALVLDAARDGYACIGVGEMGIANTTSATALFSALLGLDPGAITGPGAGAGPQMVSRKIKIVKQAVEKNAENIKNGDPIKILAALGGYEIAMMAGIMLGSASQRLPFLVDGFICTAAYAAARAIWPPVSGYAFLAHVSAEPAFGAILEKLDSGRPLLDLQMRLGEGTGSATALPLLRGAAAIFNDMADFSSAHVSASESDRIN